MGKKRIKRTSGLRESKQAGINPKDLLGASRLDPTLIPPVAIAFEASAMAEGGFKYGEYNWRVVPIQSRTYIGAAYRHLGKYLDGEDYDPKTGVHHLAYVRACCGILLDATTFGTLDDNRPIPKPDGKGSSAASIYEIWEGGMLPDLLKDIQEEYDIYTPVKGETKGEGEGE